MMSFSTFEKHWRNYLWQGACATLGLFLLLVILSLQRAIIVASFGATAFIVFMKPQNSFAAPRNVIGGHFVALGIGLLFALIPHPTPLLAKLLDALTVGCTMLIMVVSDTEHPPAAGTALSVVTQGFSWPLALAIVTSALLMALFHEVLKPYLRDL